MTLPRDELWCSNTTDAVERHKLQKKLQTSHRSTRSVIFLVSSILTDAILHFPNVTSANAKASPAWQSARSAPKRRYMQTSLVSQRTISFFAAHRFGLLYRTIMRRNNNTEYEFSW